MFKLINKKFIPINWFYIQAYCEYQLYLDKILHIKAPFPKKLYKGLEQHQKLECEFKKKATPLERPLHEQIPLVISGEEKPFSMRELPIKSDKYLLSGKIDEIHFYPDRVLIIDNKPSDFISLGTKRQLRAYSLALTDSFQRHLYKEQKIIHCMQHSATKQFLFAEQFTAKPREDILSTLQRMHALFNGEEEFIRTERKNRCNACRFNFYCKNYK